jgi:predicted enzyme related to lactoylglutathione lyase
MEVTAYAPGTPSWIDVTTADLPATVEFLKELFGWNAVDMGEQAGHYTMFDIGGKRVAAASAQMPDDAGPSAWTTYVTVADADATAAKAKELGGTVLMAPMDVFDAGRMAVLSDPTGGVFAIWQPGTSIGAELVNEPNTLCWNELNTRDPDALLPFYRSLFDWEVVKQEAGDGMTYRELRLDGRRLAGCIQMDEKWPEGLPTHWMVYFAVEDCDATAARAKSLGGVVHVEPSDIPVGRFAIIQDPGGAVCSVITLKRDI